jgi:hypothetical protein
MICTQYYIYPKAPLQMSRYCSHLVQYTVQQIVTETYSSLANFKIEVEVPVPRWILQHSPCEGQLQQIGYGNNFVNFVAPMCILTNFLAINLKHIKNKKKK